MRRCGFSRQKAGYGRGLAQAVASGALDFARLALNVDFQRLVRTKVANGTGDAMVARDVEDAVAEAYRLDAPSDANDLSNHRPFLHASRKGHPSMVRVFGCAETEGRRPRRKRRRHE